MLYDPLAWLTWACIFLGATYAWLQPSRRDVHAPLLLACGYTAATLDLYISWEALPILAVLFIAGWSVQSTRPIPQRVAGHIVYIALAVALAAHLLPGFDNPIAVRAVRTSPDAAPFTMYLNLDKPLVGFWALLSLSWVPARRFWRYALPAAGGTLLVAIPVCLLLAVALDIVDWEPKFPPYTVIWALNNLLLVCVAEEAFFRGYVQRGLSRLWGNGETARYAALVVAAVLSGMAHYAGGWRWMLLAGAAGLAYGWAYRRGGLRASVPTHFGLNAAHFFFFTYPALQTSGGV